MLYTGNELKKILRQLIVFVVIDIAVLAAGLILSFNIGLNQSKYTGTALVCVTVFLFIFILGNFVLPVVHYYKYLMEIFTGRYTERTGIVKSLGEKPVYKDNKNYYYEVDIDIGDDKCALYLYDANLNDIPFSVGDRITVTACENYMVKVRKENE